MERTEEYTDWYTRYLGIMNVFDEQARAYIFSFQLGIYTTR